MKNFLLLFFAILFTGSLAAQDVAQVQKSLITKRTATWCSFCGTWGWTLFDHLVADNHPEAVMVAAHFGDSQLENPTSLAWVANLGGSGQPRFYLNNTLQSASAATIQATRTNMMAQVDDFYAQSPLANTGMEVTQNGDQLSVQAKVRFFEAAEGTYHLALYVIEDSISAQQAGIGVTRHKLVLQESMSSDPFGELLATGNIDAGTDFDLQFEANLSSYDADQVRVIAVIWKKEGNDYLFVNVESTPELKNLPVQTSEVAASPLQMRILGNPGSTPELQLFSDRSGNLEVSIWNAAGQLVSTRYQGPLAAGQPLMLRIEDLDRGLYWVRARQGNSLLTGRVIVH